MKVQQEELDKFIKYIEDYLECDYVTVIIDMARAIYMLHYVEEDDVKPLEIKNVSYELQQLMEAFYEAHQVQQKVA